MSCGILIHRFLPLNLFSELDLPSVFSGLKNNFSIILLDLMTISIYPSLTLLIRKFGFICSQEFLGCILTLFFCVVFTLLVGGGFILWPVVFSILSVLSEGNGSAFVQDASICKCSKFLYHYQSVNTMLHWTVGVVLYIVLVCCASHCVLNIYIIIIIYGDYFPPRLDVVLM